MKHAVELNLTLSNLSTHSRSRTGTTVIFAFIILKRIFSCKNDLITLFLALVI